MHTESAALLGTPAYMSPEQCRGAGQVDRRSDIYSAGCVLFAILVGRPPFGGDGIGDIIAQHMREAPPRPSSLARRIPEDVDELILRCLEKDPAKRFDDGAALAREIDRVTALLPAIEATERGVEVVPAVAITRASPSTIEVDTTLSSSVAVMTTPQPRSRGLVLAGGGLAVVIIGIVAWQLAQTKEPRAVAPLPLADAMLADAPRDAPARSEPEVQEPRLPVIAALLAFSRWASTHAGAACPNHGELGVLEDAWHHPLAITCTEQPEGQQIGVISSGPDGVRGTADDIQSWKLPEAKQLAGARWRANKPVVPRSPPVDAGVQVAAPPPDAHTRALISDHR